MKPASWRTTTLGILSILGAVIPIVTKALSSGKFPDGVDLAAAWAAVSAGLGLIFAKDHAN